MKQLLMVVGLALTTLSCAGAAETPPAPAPTPKAAQDTCGVAKLEYLVGRNKSEIPPTPAGANWRIYCSSCLVTMDYSPARLDIVFDDKTGIVKEVKCG